MKRLILILGILTIILLVVAALGGISSLNNGMEDRIDSFKEAVLYALNPPEPVVSNSAPRLSEDISSSELADLTRTPTPTISLTRTTAAPATVTAFPSATITPSPTPLPSEKILEGFTHAFQMLNNDGPANLAIALSYWGWSGDQRDAAAFLKPNERDKNVMPYEMQDFLESETDFRAITRVGGDLQILKALISGGFPVIVEKGYEGSEFDGWMGHYQVVSGFDDGKEVFYTQDSLKGPDFTENYGDFLKDWRAFNYSYVVPYPLDSETKVLEILGEQANAYSNFLHASEIAVLESDQLSGRDLFFAFYNLGTNLVRLNDYGSAAVAYDAAFANYQELPDEIKPWRILWYQTGPYFSYYYTGRYEDIIVLADNTLGKITETILEESYYWRARAKLALGDQEGAIADFQKSLEAHPGFTPSIEELRRLGVQT
ncbi:MAG: C39 family peptidase [Anaerolineales bacterium]